MHSRNFLRALPRCLLGAALVAGITTTAGVYAVDGNPPGLFELDGNTLDAGPALGDDWGGLYLDSTKPYGNSAAFTGVLADQAPLTIFWQGGSKDIEDVTQWRYKDGSVPDKDDITNAYAAAYTVPAGQGDSMNEPGDLIIYFGLDRFANNGDAFAGFWFFQDAVGLGANSRFEGEHMPGDLLVLVEYPQGANAVPEIKVYEWVTSGGNVTEHLDQIFSASAKCNTPGDKLACAITNTGDLAGEPQWDYMPKNGFNGLPFESFFEGGINVSKLLGGEVPCFSSFLAETRSSRSETAQLKDFVLGDFDLCSIDVTKKCNAEVNEAGNSILVSFDGLVTNDGGLTLHDVTVTDDMGTADTSDDKVVFSVDTLAPGDSMPYNGSYSTLVPSPITDTVTAEGHRGLATVTDTATANCGLLLESDIQVTKLCDEQKTTINEAGTGLDVFYTGVVTNAGDDMLKNVKVVDDGGTPGVPGDDQTFNLGDLAPGGTANYNGHYSVIGTAVSTDVVIATGTGALTGTPVQATAKATCSDTVEPDIAVTKRCTGASINEAGTGIVASFAGTVTNEGNVKLIGVKVVDDSGTPGVPGDDQTFDLGDLAPGASANYSGSYGIEGFTSTDTVVASGTDVLTGATPTDSAFAVCAADTNPLIAIDKVCTDAPAFGQPILVQITVSNPGDVALFGVVVKDDNATPGDSSDDPLPFNLGDLAPGDSVSFSTSYTPALAGTYTNTAVAEATAADGAQVSEFDTATCDVPPPPEFEGCTPGFWKNSPGSWEGYSPNQPVKSVFTLPAELNGLGNDKLIAALGYPGGEDLVGAAQILLRAAVASLLNSAHPDVDFPRSTADVIADVNAALATKDRATILALASALDADNNLGCPLANDNSF